MQFYDEIMDDVGQSGSLGDNIKVNIIRDKKRVPATFFEQEEFHSFDSTYHCVDFIRFFLPGGTTHDRKVEEEDKANYPREWQAYKNKQKIAIDGIPLEMWPVCTKGMVSQLKALNLFSVENLADAPANVIQKIGMGGGDLQKKAQDYLAAQKDSSVLTKLTSDNDSLREELNDTKTLLVKLQKELENLKKKKDKGTE